MASPVMDGYTGGVQPAGSFRPVFHTRIARPPVWKQKDGLIRIERNLAMTNIANLPEQALHGKKADLRCSAYRLTMDDLDNLLQVQFTLALLSKLTYDVTRDASITLEEMAAVARYACTYLDQWLDRVHEAPIDELC